MKIKPKVGESIVVWHDGELKPGIVTEVFDVIDDYSTGLKFIFKFNTKRKKYNYQKEEYKYIDCELRGNSFTLNPIVDANINWAPAKNVGSKCFVFRSEKEYNDWARNEINYNMLCSKSAYENHKSQFENYKETKLINYDINE